MSVLFHLMLAADLGTGNLRHTATNNHCSVSVSVSVSRVLVSVSVSIGFGLEASSLNNTPVRT